MNVEKNTDGEKSEDDRKVSQAGRDKSESAFRGILSRQHPLNHVLIGSMGGHCDKGGGEKAVQTVYSVSKTALRVAQRSFGK